MATKARRRERHQGQARRARWGVYLAGAVAAGIVVAGVVVVGALTREGGDDGVAGPVIIPTPGLPGLVSQGRVLGSQGAPVSIVEYADFQ